EGAGTLTLAAADTRLELDTPTPVRVGETACLSATLTSEGAPLSGQPVAFRVAGADVGTASTNEAGVASLDLKVEEGPAGERPVEATFSGGDGHAAASDASALSVQRAPTEVVVASLRAHVGDRVSLRATLSRTTDARVLAGKSVSFLVNGLAVGSATTGADGAAELPFDTDILTAGTHSVTARFAEDDSYLASEGEGTLTLIGVAATQLGLDDPSPVRVGETARLSATLTADGAPLVGRTLAFRIAGADTGTAVTNDEGVASLDLKIEEGPAGERSVEASFPGEDAYAPAGDSGTLEVLRAPTEIAASSLEAEVGARVSLRATLSRTTDARALS
ncbi:MAG: Ig-like domain repeat protein, partial [Myxococcales bacterium]